MEAHGLAAAAEPLLAPTPPVDGAHAPPRDLEAPPRDEADDATVQSDESGARDRCRICHDADVPLISPCWCTGSVRTICHACLDEWRRMGDRREQWGWSSVCCEICGAPWLFEARVRETEDLRADVIASFESVRTGFRSNVLTVGLCGSIVQIAVFALTYLFFVGYVLENSLGCILFCLCVGDGMSSVLGRGWLGSLGLRLVAWRDRSAELRRLHEQEWNQRIPQTALPAPEWGPEAERKVCLQVTQCVVGAWMVGMLTMPHWSGPVIRFLKVNVADAGRSLSGRLFTGVYLAILASLLLFVETTLPPFRLCRTPDGQPVIRGRTEQERKVASPELRAQASPALRSHSSPAFDLPALGPL